MDRSLSAAQRGSVLSAVATFMQQAHGLAAETSESEEYTVLQLYEAMAVTYMRSRKQLRAMLRKLMHPESKAAQHNISTRAESEFMAFTDTTHALMRTEPPDDVVAMFLVLVMQGDESEGDESDDDARSCTSSTCGAKVCGSASSAASAAYSSGSSEGSILPAGEPRGRRAERPDIPRRRTRSEDAEILQSLREAISAVEAEIRSHAVYAEVLKLVKCLTGVTKALLAPDVLCGAAANPELRKFAHYRGSAAAADAKLRLFIRQELDAAGRAQKPRKIKRG